jgi:hypothetical protein
VFESYNPENKWNGTYQSEYYVQAGIYAYKLVYSTQCSEPERLEKSGAINVIR